MFYRYTYIMTYIFVHFHFVSVHNAGFVPARLTALLENSTRFAGSAFRAVFNGKYLFNYLLFYKIMDYKNVNFIEPDFLQIV